jgi:hypothetical protein
MSGQQKTVLWIGLILIALNLVGKWSQIRGIIFTGSGSTAPPDSGSGGSTDKKPPSIQIPIDPFIPGPTIPKITVPLPHF